MNSDKRECFGKQMFKTDASAKRRARYLKLKGERSERGQHPYYCKICKSWHLTSEKGKGKWAR